MSDIIVCNFDRVELFGVIEQSVEKCFNSEGSIFNHCYNCNVKIQESPQY